MATNMFPPVEGNEKELPDFFDVGVIWNTKRLPWFLVTVQTENEGHRIEEVLMVPTHSQMKIVMMCVDETFEIQSVDYVTPGHMNRSGKWMIEPVLELSELSNATGGKIARCKVSDTRIYRGGRLECPKAWGNEQLIYKGKKP